jgi:uncharacterized membrane protein YeaQ/YmgE (transglycosylase-associated protein family)
MNLQALIILLIVGAIAGWLAGTLVKGAGFGLVGNIVIGMAPRSQAGFCRKSVLRLGEAWSDARSMLPLVAWSCWLC